jgi:hypothetical protein
VAKDAGQTGYEHDPAEIRHAFVFELGEEVLGIEPRVETCPDHGAFGYAPEAFINEPDDAVGGVHSAAPQFGVQARSEPGREAQQRVQGVALGPRRVRTLPPR